MLIQYLLKLLVYTLAILLVSRITNLIYVKNFQTAFLFSIVLGLINVIIKPLFIVLTIPITIITFGIFLFFINGLMIMISASFFRDIEVNGCFSAAIASLLISLFVYIFSKVLFGRLL
ncbi:MAG: phage holin family protein [Candidatus Cloacimonadota bacterium]|nr:phage holin family protein [Candidatus Cloacimonadota bacterium]